MQPSPTTTLPGSGAPRLRTGITIFHGALFAGLLALGACHDPKVTTYRVAKDTESAVANTGATAQMPPLPTAPADEAQASAAPLAAPTSGSAATPANPHAVTSGASLTWTAPADWQSKQAGSMRKATYELGGAGAASAELAISAFPGDVGGESANVNRWRGQVGLNPVSDADATASVQRLEVNGLKIGVVDVVDHSAPDAVHMLGAMVPFDGSTWFFKLVGPDAVVAARKAAFLDFLKTVKPATTTQP